MSREIRDIGRVQLKPDGTRGRTGEEV